MNDDNKGRIKRFCPLLSFLMTNGDKFGMINLE